MTTLHVREDALRSAVAAYPVVASLRTETDFPHGLRIVVNAHEPVAAVTAGGGADGRRRATARCCAAARPRGLPVVAIRPHSAPASASRAATRSARCALLAAAPRALRGRVERAVPRSARPDGDDGRRARSSTSAGPRGCTRSGAPPRRCWPAAPRAGPRTSTCGFPSGPAAGGLEPRSRRDSTCTLG